VKATKTAAAWASDDLFEACGTVWEE